MKINLNNNTIVLCYHRIIDDTFTEIDFPNDGQSLKCDDFEKHLIYLKKHYTFVNDLESNIINKKKYNLFLTFDDGFLDIKTIVLPLLEKYNIPAMIFITSGFIDNNYQFVWWIDFWNNLKNKKSITIITNGIKKNYNFNTLKSKNKIYSIYIKKLFKMSRDEQYNFFKENNLGTNTKKYFLSKTDIAYLQNHYLIKIGLHSHLHMNYGIECERSINYDLLEMNKYFDENNIKTHKKYFALCYGSLPNLHVLKNLEIKFDLIFALGIKSYLISNKKIISRINVSSKQSLLRLKINLMLIKFIIFLKNVRIEK